mmetsp:Transcript_76803/g.207420  ORF Transcript_76803/g.207420 Transcript_76803/m.207420 type:complete len:213 (-) Transcript_76803:123-761(-)
MRSRVWRSSLATRNAARQLVTRMEDMRQRTSKCRLTSILPARQQIASQLERIMSQCRLMLMPTDRQQNTSRPKRTEGEPEKISQCLLMLRPTPRVAVIPETIENMRQKTLQCRLTLELTARQQSMSQSERTESTPEKMSKCLLTLRPTVLASQSEVTEDMRLIMSKCQSTLRIDLCSRPHRVRLAPHSLRMQRRWRLRNQEKPLAGGASRTT